MITLDMAGIRGRQVRIRNMVKPLCRVRAPEVVLDYRSDQLNLVVGRPTGSLRDTRYPLRIESFFLNYFEVWNDVGQGRFCLEKAYCHIDRVAQGGVSSQEVVALHSDPTTPEDDQQYLYKSGPHLHFSLLPGDLSRAHVALCLDKHKQTIAHAGTFSDAMGRIVQMLNVEFVSRLQSLPSPGAAI